jgi:penicillin-binding protein 1A
MCLGVPFDPELWETEAAYEQDCRRTTLWRKIQEVPFAFAMELRYSKDEILSIYLNRAYLGAGARGFEGRRSAISACPQPRSCRRRPRCWPASGRALLLRAHPQPGTRAAAGGDGPRADAAGRATCPRPRRRPAVANPAILSEAAEQNIGGYFADWIMAEGPIS